MFTTVAYQGVLVMLRTLIAGITLAAGCAAVVDYPEPASGIQRSDLFVFASGDRIEDSGRLLVTGGRFNRTEDFEVVRTAQGGRVISSIVTAADNRYRVHARWEYSASEQALSATGIGSYEGQPVTVDIKAEDGTAALIVAGALNLEQTAPCGSDCLVDLAPGALAMFTMTRRYDEARGGPQTLRWVGRSLVADQLLLEGAAEIRKLGDFIFRQDDRETAVKQYVFVEKLKDEVSGRVSNVAFNLYTTADHRPLAFATAGTTLGERAGYAGIVQALPPRIPQID
jgi:hypothetical protein